MKKIAIDWDDSELRYVLGHLKGASLQYVIAAGVVKWNAPPEASDVTSALRELQADFGIENVPTLVTIGRGKAELRDLQLPPVPVDELPEMVRMQVVHGLANAGENASVDFLPTERTNEHVKLIAAAISAQELKRIGILCSSALLDVQRVCLRPLATVALHRHFSASDHETKNNVLVDLLADEAEIAIIQSGVVRSLRTVRLPAGASRSNSLVRELKRSLVSCGEEAAPDQLVLWGDEEIHRDDVDALNAAFPFPVQVINPFKWIPENSKTDRPLPAHSGRFAPLIGMLVADQAHSAWLIDFLNPRKRYEAPPNRGRKALLTGIPIALAAVLGYFVLAQMRSLDHQIKTLKDANAAVKPEVDQVVRSIARTEKVDQFLDGDVNWLEELKRLSEQMPASENMIITSLNANSDPRRGGGKLNVIGSVKNPDVIDQFENALRDENHEVLGDHAKEDTRNRQADGNSEYPWSFSESIQIDSQFVRNRRYEGIQRDFQSAVDTSGDSASSNQDSQAPVDQEPSNSEVDS